MFTFALASWIGWGSVVTSAAIRRGRLYATFAGVMLGVHTLVSVAVAPVTGIAWPILGALQGGVFVHFLMLSAPAMRPAWYRAVVSLPASWFAAGTFLAFPWAIAKGIGLSPVGWWIPYAVAGVGLIDSLFAKDEVVDITIDQKHTPELTRMWKAKGTQTDKPLTIVQITDPHLGPFMSEAKLRKICEDAVQRNPDLILLTGDFLTMESQTDPDVLARALAPLKTMQGKTFACLGNHDHEALDVVTSGLRRAGVQLLVDELTTIETANGPLEILGFDFVWRERAKHMEEVFQRFPRKDGVGRIALLHDPGAFRHLPEGAADLVLSGHTHGGQVGLLRFGLPFTIVSALSKVPDHGLWAKGKQKLYVHRGTGHYGFPLRVGVPAEQSLLRVHWT